MKHIYVTNIQSLCVSDGPGIRTVVFLKGCSLRCPWCCNPEAIYRYQDVIYDNNCCIKERGSQICNNCELKKGKESITNCPIKAYESTYRIYTPELLIDKLKKDFDNHLCCGVTFSGGEPLLQIEALVDVLTFIKSRGLTVAFETTLFVPEDNFKKAVSYTDHWLVDMKCQLGFFINQEISVEKKEYEANLSELQNLHDANVSYRMVLLREGVDKADEIASKLILNHITRIEILPVHNLAESKYNKLHRKFHRFAEPTFEEIEHFCSVLNNRGIMTDIGK